MSDATISALLEELREVDFETWNTINIRCRFIEASYGTEFGQDFIQGCIQRVIAAKGWAYQVACTFQKTSFGKIITKDPDGSKIFHPDHAGETPAAALLAAYIDAVRAIK